MKERILEFLRAENKSSAQLAEEIGVQPSGISHILSGRNNPSLDFILKMLEKYKLLSTDWLLFGKGSMYKGTQMQSLFDETSDFTIGNNTKQSGNEAAMSDSGFQEMQKEQVNKEIQIPRKNGSPVVQKIVWFFDNNSFEEFFPRR